MSIHTGGVPMGAGEGDDWFWNIAILSLMLDMLRAAGSLKRPEALQRRHSIDTGACNHCVLS